MLKINIHLCPNYIATSDAAQYDVAQLLRTNSL